MARAASARSSSSPACTPTSARCAWPTVRTRSIATRSAAWRSPSTTEFAQESTRAAARAALFRGLFELAPGGTERRRRPVGHAHQLGFGHARLIGGSEFHRIEGNADRILAEGVAREVGRAFLFRLVAIDLQLDRVAVGIAIVQRYRGTMMDRPIGLDALVLQAAPGREQLAYVAERVGDMGQTP